MEPYDVDGLRASCQALPLFPLPNLVFLPSTLLPLHVFEPRYRKLARDCLEGTRFFAVPCLREGWQADYDGRPAVHAVAGVGRIVREQALADGRYNLLVLGVGRVRIEEEPPTDEPYRVARAVLLEDRLPEGGELALRDAVDRVRILTGQIMAAHPLLATEFHRALAGAENPAQLIDRVGHLALREAEERQRFLESTDPVARADLVVAGLAGLLGLASSVEA